MDIYLFVKWLEKILLVYIRPILAAIALVNNILIIITIMRKRNHRVVNKKCFTENMYSHMLVNSVFNALYACIMATSLLNTRVFYSESSDGTFCSGVYRTTSAQYYKIWVIEFFGNMVKTCVNISYIMFVTNRLVFVAANISEKSRSIKNAFEKLKFKIYLPILICFASLISLHKLFEYKVNEFMILTISFPSEIYSELYCVNQICSYMDSFKLLNDTLNDLLFCLLSLLIDIILLKCVSKELKKKILIRGPRADNKDLDKSQKNVDRMVLSNGFIYFLSHVPEFSMTLGLLIFRERLVKFCTKNNACDLLREEATCLTLIASVFQFYVLLIFNENFRKNFKELFQRS